jgi:hypothetical protein
MCMPRVHMCLARADLDHNAHALCGRAHDMRRPQALCARGTGGRAPTGGTLISPLKGVAVNANKKRWAIAAGVR